jgi:hypothetical protein
MILGMKLLIKQKMCLQLKNKHMSTLYLTLLISLKLPETELAWLILAQDHTQDNCGTMESIYFGNTSLIFMKLTKKIW